MIEWSNWSGSVVCHPEQIDRPGSAGEGSAGLRRLVQHAASSGKRVRVAGSGHSFVPLCASDEFLVQLEGLSGVIACDRAAATATVRAGTRLFELGPLLWDQGLAMETLGDIDRQALAGAISTGTHGTGRNLRNLSSQVIAMILIDGRGEERTLTAQDGDLLRAARIALGSLGIVTEITLALLPAYRLRERSFAEPFAACQDSLEERIEQNRHYEFFWDPSSDTCFHKTLNIGSESTSHDPEPDFERYEDERAMVGEALGPSYKVLPTARDRRFNEIEFTVDEAAGWDCFLALRELLRDSPPAGALAD